MISRQKMVVSLLSVPFFLLGYYLLMPYFQVHDVIERSTEESTIRINQLNAKDGSSVNETIHLQNATSSTSDSVPESQSLELDRAHSLQIKMYGERAFFQEQYLFDPSEKVFLAMEFNQLEAGEYDLHVLWNDPRNRLINTSRHSISLTRQSPKHLSYFWLKLMRNGLFTEMLTGNEYKGDIHGRWAAEIYLDGYRLTTQHFMVYN